MPEGDTVWRTARRLDQALSGQTLTRCDIRVPDFATIDVTGQLVIETISRGKHLLTRVGELSIHTHLLMEGAWHIYRPGSRWRSPAHAARILLANAQWEAVGLRLGTVEVIARSAEKSVVGHLGPDLLGADWSLDEALSRLTRCPERAVGEALLDQRNLAGIGNLYKSEVCFLLGVHPLTPVSRIDVLPALVSKAQILLAANKERAEQTTTGDVRHGQQTWVYGRAGLPCRRCGTGIASARQGASGAERGTYWCPRCQP
ncbi:MAG: DNA-formamidopyrimidine glycosylase family protein [Nocardioidaceae bacterium]